MKKRFLALLLSAVMTLSPSVTAFAAEDVTYLENDSSNEVVIEISDEDTETEDADFSEASEESSLEENEEIILDTEENEDPDSIEVDAADAEASAETAETAEDNVFATGLDLSNSNYELIRGEAFDEAELQGSYPSYYYTSKLPPLRDQNPYGTCWAFAISALTEINLMKNGIYSNPDLSELHLAYFRYNSVVDPLGGTAGDSVVTSKSSILNLGGNYDAGCLTLLKWTGAASEATVPYSMAKTAQSSGLSASLAYNDQVHLENYFLADVKTDAFRSSGNLAYLDQAKKMIYEYGAAGISYGAVNSMQAVTSNKIYSTKYASYYNSSYIEPNHAVVVIGWDDNYSRYNFATTAPGDGAWLVRNSWSTKGSLDNKDYTGYFWMSYYEPSIHNLFYAVKANTAKNYDNNYQYDGCTAGPFNYVAKGANVFTAHANSGKSETLKAVSFCSYAYSTNYTVEIYKNVKDTPNSGTLVSASTTTGTTPFAGYITVPLKKAVTIEAGTKFAVVVTLGVAGLVYDKSGTTTDGTERYVISAKAGESYQYSYGSWTSMNDNLRIKAFTNNSSSGSDPAPTPSPEPTPEKKLKSVTLTKQEISEDKVKFTLSYDPSDYSPKSIKWSSSDTAVATVDNSGNVTIKDIGSAYITAEVDGVKGTGYVRKDLPDDYAKISASADGSVTLKWKAVKRATEYKVIRAVESEHIQIATIKNDGRSEFEYTDDYYKDNSSYGGKTVFYGMYAVINGSDYGGFVYVTLPSQEALDSIWIVEDETEDGKLQLVARFRPYLYVPRGKLVWSSSDNNVGTIDQNGIVTFKDVGDVTFTATVDGVSDSVDYEVWPNVTLEQNMGKVYINWKKSNRATSYELYRESGEQGLIYSTNNSGSLSFTDSYFYDNPVKSVKTVHYLLRIKADFGNGETYRDYGYDVVVAPRGTDVDDEEGWGDISDDSLRKFFNNNPANVPLEPWFVVAGKVYKGYDEAQTQLSATYTGSKITFDDEIDVYRGKYKLVKKSDYKITYKGNTSANDASSNIPTVTLQGTGRIKFKKVFHFSILPESIAKAGIASETVVPVAKGSKKLGAVKPKVTFNGKTLKNNKDYFLVYKDQNGNEIEKPSKVTLNEVGATYYISAYAVEGGNFTGAVSDQVKVVVVSSKEVKLASGFTLGDANGKALKVDFGKIVTGSDVQKLFTKGEAAVFYKKAQISTDNYKVVLLENDYSSAGTHKIRLVAKDGSEFCGSKIVSFKVLPYNITDDAEGRLIIEAGPARYSSNGAVPLTNVYFKGLDGKVIKLVKGVDYTVTYKNNRKVATENAAKAPTIVIKGKGRLTGTATKTFTIHK